MTVGLVLAGVYAVALVALTVATAKQGLGRLNPMSVFAVVWVVVVLLYQLPILDLRPLALRTYLLLATASGAFAAGVYAVAIRSRWHSELCGEFRHYNDARFVRAQRFATIALGSYVTLQLLRLLPVLTSNGGLTGILSGDGSGNAWRRATMAFAVEQGQTSFTGVSLVVAALGYLLFLGALSLFWAGYFARQGRWGLALPPLIIMAVYSLALLQRAAFIYAALPFAFSWYYHRDRGHPVRRSGRASRLLAPALAAVVVPIVIVLPLQLKQPDLSSVEQASNVLTYVDSGVAGLNTLVVDDPQLKAAQPVGYTGKVGQGFGVWTFFGAASIAARFGAPLTVPPNYFRYEPIQQSGAGLSNTYSFMLYFLYDFGWPGLVGLSFLLGMTATGVHRRVRAQADLRLVPLACVLMSSITMSFFGLTMIRDVRYLFLIAFGMIVHERLTESSPSQLSDVRDGLVAERATIHG